MLKDRTGQVVDADLDAARLVTPETRFRLASVTKAITALAVLQLQDEGAVSLESPVEDYVPEFGSANRSTREGQIALTAGAAAMIQLLHFENS